jgi:hypothetical protein
MQFQIEDVSYSIGRFFDLYQNKLPVVVMVTQGFYGDIIEDTFDREQVCFITLFSFLSFNLSLFILLFILRSRLLVLNFAY